MLFASSVLDVFRTSRYLLFMPTTEPPEDTTSLVLTLARRLHKMPRSEAVRVLIRVGIVLGVELSERAKA